MRGYFEVLENMRFLAVVLTHFRGFQVEHRKFHSVFSKMLGNAFLAEAAFQGNRSVSDDLPQQL